MNSEEARVTVGVPLITQVELSINSPAGKAVFVVQDEISAPRIFKVVGDTDIATPTDPMVPVAPAKLIDGVFAAITKVTEAVDDPAELVAVTVNAVDAKVTVGVPVITQVELSIERPAGKAVFVKQDEIAAPRLFKVVGVNDMATPTDPLLPVAPAKLIDGVLAAITKVTLAVDVPAEFVAVTVNSEEAKVTVGVPLITQVELSIERPAGKVVVVVQEEIAAPRLFKVVGDIDISTPTIPLVPVAPA